ncbi:methyltransferase type 12 [Methylobacterium currus]|uniref:Methyltransferase type 12 n=1 Tax=Methylobacterium currus TaxID=2051553 RepID=A0A2R4WJL5_9HYPH|nr:methyltransferase [Methylobacterium currus]AWB21742.1 methyltransferase type 12 [Methylobacterium currus]
MSPPAPPAAAASVPGAPAADHAFPDVERFLRHEFEARALAAALGRGVIDRLARSAATIAALAAETGLAPERLALLLGLLASGGVIAAAPDGTLALTPAFRAVLPCRDLLEAKLAFLDLVSDDLRRLFPAFIDDPERFLEQARTFELFRYDRCLVATPENCAATRPWVAYTTCLTRYEAGPILDRLDLGAHRRLLDLGGNSGEFAARACARAPWLSATVVDLPVVCALGRDNLANRAEAARVAFRPADMLRDRLPEGHDLVVFKSVLHDWPPREAADLVARAAAAVAPGGRLVVAERGPMPFGTRPVDYASAANLVFAPFFRDAAFYLEAFRRAGLVAVTAGTIDLDMPFHLVQGRKTGEPA